MSDQIKLTCRKNKDAMLSLEASSGERRDSEKRRGRPPSANPAGCGPAQRVGAFLAHRSEASRRGDAGEAPYRPSLPDEHASRSRIEDGDRDLDAPSEASRRSLSGQEIFRSISQGTHVSHDDGADLRGGEGNTGSTHRFGTTLADLRPLLAAYSNPVLALGS